MTTSYTISKVEFVWLDSANNPTSSVYPLTVSGNTATATYLPAGNFAVRVHSNTLGFAILTNPQVTIPFSGNPTTSGPITSSFVGGKQVVINGAGFVTNNPKNN